MAKAQDHLPEAERFMPFSREEAMLIFGQEISEEYPNAMLPSYTLPGTPERIEVYRERAAKRLPLFHPKDRTDFEGYGSTARRPANPITLILKKLQARKQ
jgi:hypothetical protein